MFIKYVKSSLAVMVRVVVFIVKSESKSSPGTDFVAEDMKESIWTIFVYTALNFPIGWWIKIQIFEIFQI